MSVDIILEDPRWEAADLVALAQRAAQATLVHLELEPDAIEISLLGCDDARIAVLNSDFRGKPQPTNVLSWPETDLAAEDDGQAPHPPEPEAHGPDEITLGDIAIAYETCAREASEQGKTLADHVTHLVVHGVLHLLGYDHIRDKDATLMEAIEVAILGKLGLDDPYRDMTGAI